VPLFARDEPDVEHHVGAGEDGAEEQRAEEGEDQAAARPLGAEPEQDAADDGDHEERDRNGRPDPVHPRSFYLAFVRDVGRKIARRTVI